MRSCRRGARVLIALAAVSRIAIPVGAAERVRLTELEGAQESAIITAMGTTQGRLPKGQCIRFFACVDGGDPSPGIRSRIHDAGYRAVRWCSDQPKAVISAGCEAARINVLAPLNEADQGKDRVFEISGVLGLRCRNRVDAGLPTSAVGCVPVAQGK